MNARTERLMPNGVPKYVRCYDNEGPADHYTVVFTGRYAGREGCDYLGMSAQPFHPQGIGQHGSSEHMIDRPRYGHLGKRISFRDLPEDCQTLVLSDYRTIWDLKEEVK